jgi:hypothetical protein
VLPKLLPLALAVIALSAVGLFFVLRRFKPPPRADHLPASVPIALSEPDLERFAAAAAEGARSKDPATDISGDAILDAIRSGDAGVEIGGLLESHVVFRLASMTITVDRAGKLVELIRA